MNTPATAPAPAAAGRAIRVARRPERKSYTGQSLVLASARVGAADGGHGQHPPQHRHRGGGLIGKRDDPDAHVVLPRRLWMVATADCAALGALGVMVS